MDKMLGERETFLKDVKSQIGRDTKSEFRSALGQRNYTGKMTFQHENQTIEFSVNPREVDKKKMKVAKENSSATGAATSLSGGERSFTTASFILALWSCMDTPFRALDEFDVFMDAVNRQIVRRFCSFDILDIAFARECYIIGSHTRCLLETIAYA
jgi:chromosome segregation ATPase